MASDPIHSDWGEISQLHLIANNEEGVMCANKILISGKIERMRENNDGGTGVQ